MGRLPPDMLSRAEAFAHRVVDVAEHLQAARRSWRIVHQMIGSGTSVAANLFEADEAQTAREFCRCLGISARELSETSFWLRFVLGRGWVTDCQLSPLQRECDELRRIVGTMIVRTRQREQAVHP